MIDSLNQETTIDRDLLRRIEQDPFAQSLGIETLSVAPGYAEVRMRLKPHMANAHGIPHGGVIFSLADTAFALASNAHGVISVGLDVSITFCRAAVIGSQVLGYATEKNLTRHTGLYELKIVDENHNLIAQAQGTVYRTNKPIIQPTDTP
jgi:acyl-CoA thioesterase